MDLIDMAGHVIRRLQQASTLTFTQHMKAQGYNLTSVQFAAMHVLNEHGTLEQAKIAALIAYDRATIGGVIDRLESKAWVKRIVSPEDRRARQVSLTIEGRGVYTAILPIVVELQKDILIGLTSKEQQQFIRLARKAIGLTNNES
jgi:DNA-binding MarR family transcriptional regulator